MEAQKTNYIPIPQSKRFHDYTKREFGFWTVLGYMGKRNENQIWECRCVCGKVKIVQGSSLSSGASVSCGCESVKLTIARNTTHGMSRSTEYSIRTQMINRCTNPKAINWKDYGGRGIKVCGRWMIGEHGKSGFECFLADMGPRPSGLTIHRKDGNGNYEPGNCVWATWLVQNNESRHNNMITWMGKEKSLSSWAREVGLTRETLSCRIHSGWDVERALTTPQKNAA